MKSVMLALILTLLPCFAHAQSETPFKKGDSFDLRLSGQDSEMTNGGRDTYTIDDKGMIDVPSLGKLKVVGLLPGQVHDLVLKAAEEKKLFLHPIVVVTPARLPWINVVGEVMTPQRVPFKPGMTFLAAINACGGFSTDAEKVRIRLNHNGKILMLNAVEIQNNPSHDILLSPGDQIVVKQTPW